MSPEKRRENHRLLLTAPFAFYVINFEPIEVQTCSAPQNDHPNLSSVKDIGHTCKNLIPMVVTRAMANSSKNHAFLMCRI